MSSLSSIQIILVCQGAEYKAVCQGLSRIPDPKPVVVPMPIGSKAVLQYLTQWQQAGSILAQPQPKVLVMGLCGSLNPLYRVGDVVLYQNCIYRDELEPQILPCDRSLTDILYARLQEKIALVTALTSDRFIYAAAQKRYLGETLGADVVDMEGASVLKALIPAGVAVTMLRVISDDCDHDLPNLAAAVSPEGSLQTLPLAIAMIRQPIAATRLIRGSLQGLKILQKVSTAIFSR